MKKAILLGALFVGASLLTIAKLSKVTAVSSPATALENTSLQHVLDTGQGHCYDDNGVAIACPTSGGYFGQDAQFSSHQPNFIDNGNGTVSEQVSGLTWQKSPPNSRFTWHEADQYCQSLSLGGDRQWRLPSVKELFSISDFEAGWPYIDTTRFELATEHGQDKAEQYWSSNEYKVETNNASRGSAFGVNHATGHIKAYPIGKGGRAAKQVRCVSGTSYLVNEFVDNEDGTVTDHATGLIWAQVDNGKAVDWQTALNYAKEANIAGYQDWRVPNIKELQSIVDYSGVYPAIDSSKFKITDKDSYFWSSTSAYFNPGKANYYYAWYVAFGYAVGPDGNDVHGAGAVRFDTKVAGGPAGEEPERVYNYVRLVRGGNIAVALAGDPKASNNVEWKIDPQQQRRGPPNRDRMGLDGAREQRHRPPKPDLAEAAEVLGISESALKAALGDPKKGPPNLKSVAKRLNIPQPQLEQALRASHRG